MSATKDTGGPAFPLPPFVSQNNATGEMTSHQAYSEGMSLRQYAAIKLRVPDSGTDWLDDMIRTSLRDELAAKAMQGMFAADTADSVITDERKAEYAYAVASAMLAESAKGGE